MLYKGKGGKQYDLAQSPLAQGGEGRVYTVNGNKQIVAKLYKNGLNTVEKERKLITMVDNPPDQKVMSQIAWPMDVLYDNGNRFVGFIMPMLSINEELNVMYEYGSTAKYPNIPWSSKIAIAKNLCAVLYAVHSAGHVVGDFNPKNISVDPNTGYIVFVDTDSYHIEDNGTVYRCNVGMPEYLPVEVQRKMSGGLSNAPLPTFSKETDNFALAVHIFQLLMNGTHPFACKILPSTASIVFPQPTDNILNGVFPFMQPTPGTTIPLYAPPIDILPQYIQDLFNRAFLTGHVDPKSRPDAIEWYNALTQLESEITNCKKCAHHEYHNSQSKCPWCEVDKRFAAGVSGKQPPMSIGQKPIPTPISTGHTGQHNPTPYGAGGGGTTTKSGGKKKATIIAIALICVVLLIGGITGGTYYSNAMKEVNSVISLVDSLPELANVTDFDSYEETITDVYERYSALSDWQKNKVTNRNKLLSIVPEYNEYVVENLRQSMNAVSAETISTTEYLKETVEKYGALNAQQKDLLSSDEIKMLDNYAKVYETITAINAINNDLVNKYGTLSDTKALYNSIDEQYRPLVYNYGLVDTFESQLAFLNNFAFTKVEGGYSIKAAEGVSFEGEVVIPSVYNNQDVITIESNAFLDQRNITSIIVPDTVTQIDSGAFSGCNRLESLTVPFVGSNISSGTFSHVFGSASVPQSLKKVTVTVQDKVVDSAFSGCNHIEQIVYEEELDYIGANSFNGCEALSSFNSSETGTVNLSGTMDKIGNSAFKNCESITHIVFSDEILTIDNYAFSGCKNIVELNLTDRLTTIGEYAFQGLKKITSVKVHNSTELIGLGAFNGCIALEEMSLPFTGRSKEPRYQYSEALAGGGGPAYYEQVLGYIFGYATQRKALGCGSNYGGAFINDKYGNVDGAIWQYTYAYNRAASDTRLSVFYYIPSSLRTVIITNQSNVQIAAFNGCSMLTNIIFTQGIESQGECAFQNCGATISDFMPSVSFDTNGGEEIQAIMGIPGTTIELPAPTKENYVFVEWQNSNGNTYNSTTMPNDNITLTAKWLPMIKFDAGTVASVDSIVQEAGSSITMPEISREGYVFAGWYNGDEKVELTTMPSESITVRAGWYKVVEKIKTVYDGGNSVYKFSGISSPSISSPLCFELDYRSLIPDDIATDTVSVVFSVDMKAGININEIRANCYNSKTFSTDTMVFSESFTEFTTSYYTYTIEQEIGTDGIVYLCFYTPNGRNNNNGDNVMCIRKLTYTISYAENTLIFE